MTIKRALVTGGSGFVGAHIVQQLLLDRNTTVAIVSRNPKHTANDRVTTHAADIKSSSQIHTIFEKVQPDVVIHTACPTHTDAPTVLNQTIIDGTEVLLSAATACPSTRAFIYTSSDSAVIPTQTLLSEDRAQLYNESHFNNVYGRSKAIADALVQAANSDKLSTVVLRIPIIYGKNLAGINDGSFVPQLVSSMRRKEHRMQVGANTKLFEFCYVEKAAEAHVLAARRLLGPQGQEGVAGEAFFVSDGRPERFFDFARRCYGAAGNPVKESEVTVIPLAVMQAVASAGEWAYAIFTLGWRRPSLRRDAIDHLDAGACWSIEKSKERLGYWPVVDQDEVMKKTMEWAMAAL